MLQKFVILFNFYIVLCNTAPISNCTETVGTCIGPNMDECPTGYYCQSPGSYFSMCCKAVCYDLIGMCIGPNMDECPTGYYCQSPGSYFSMCCKAVCYNSIGVCAMDKNGQFNLCPTGFYCDNPNAGFGLGSCCQK